MIQVISPQLDRSALLRQICTEQLEKMAAAYPDALFIPLGKCVDHQITQSGILPEDRIVHHFPIHQARMVTGSDSCRKICTVSIRK